MENLNPATIGTATFMLTSMVIGSVELVRRIFAQDWRAVISILAAVIVGGLGGALLVPVIGLAGGIVLGLSASGVITTVSRVGGTVTTPQVVTTPSANVVPATTNPPTVQ